MTSLPFPDTGTRMVVLQSGQPAALQTGHLYADAAATVTAEVYQNIGGVKGPLIPLDAQARRPVNLDIYGQQPDYFGPVDGTSRLYIKVNGVVSAVDADYRQQIVQAAGMAVGQRGGADDRARIQAAINAAAPFGAWVVIDGDRSVSGTITVPAGARIDGSRGTITQTAGLTPTFMISNASGVILRNIRATGVGSDYVASSAVLSAAAVYLTGTTSNVLIEGCDLRGHAGAGVYIGPGVTDVRVVNCRLKGPGAPTITPQTNNYGMGVLGGQGSADWSVTGCDISDYAQGVNSGDCSNVRISNCYIHDVTGQHGVYLDAATNLVISGNLIRDTGLQGIKVQLANNTVGPDIAQVSITGNVITNAGSHGVLLTKAVTGSRQSRRVSITGNTITTNGAGGDGINLIGVHGAVISGNMVHNARHGVNAATCNGLTIAANRFHTLQQNGLLLTDTTDVDVVNNRIIDPGSENNSTAEFGIQVAGASAEHRIAGNVVSDSAGNMRYGLYLSTSAQATIAVRNNDLTGATDYGARLDNTQGIKEWSGNVCAGALGTVTGYPATLTTRGAPAEHTGTAAPTSGTWERGTLVWNRTPTPGGTLGWVCTTAGTPGTWSAFGRAVSSSWNGPTANGLLGAAFDPLFANITMAAMTAGVLYLARVDLPVGGSPAAVQLLLGGAGSGLTAGQNLVGVYELAAGGALLAQSADQSTAWASTGQKAAALTVPPATQDAGAAVYVAVLFNGTTSPLLRGAAATASFVNTLVPATPRWATAGTGLTALPAALPALTAAVATPWVGLS